MQAHGLLSTRTPLSTPSIFMNQPRRQGRVVPSPTATSNISITSLAPTFSISDGDLQSRGFVLHRTPTGLDLTALNDVFARVGFPRREPARILMALENTPSLVWIEEARSGRPVAFARATGDGVFNAVVWDVVVDPSFQGIGLGKAVMERLLHDLLSLGISNIALYAEPKVLGFYRPMGFAADPDGIKGMVYSAKKTRSKKT